MDTIIVKGGAKLNGHVKVEGAKNAVLPIITAAILASKGKSTFTNVPNLSDVDTISAVLEGLNAKVYKKIEVNTVEVDASGELLTHAAYEYVSKMRASVLVLGPLLARYGSAEVAMPGGCAIGSRPIEQHLKGLRALGAEITQTNGYLIGKVNGRLKGAQIYFDFPSVGATQNIMMAASLAEGKTIIDNVAREPEIVDLANYLNKMGADVQGAGTDRIVIHGVSELTGAAHDIVPDRIVAGTFLVAAALTQGDVYVEGAIYEHMQALIAKLEEAGCTIDVDHSGIRIRADKPLREINVKTLPHPGFPTDMQAQMMALMLVLPKESTMHETVFENRFMHVAEFAKMNAKITVDKRIARVSQSKLQGAEVKATDLRSAAALILAGLVAEGYTKVTELYHLDRGYVDFHQKLRSLGAEIERTGDLKESLEV
ncbi:UDP-N-acetylglucosamine 1-carboxyvinyltransferase [Macrococcus sp. EM39E]|uniref:UDP-N-acetylglucosamine 1-carboxyvinyltransferase n=1 Tax=Macrococcus animalis TaxID=3395467 RepID=UPI0039BF5FD3